LAGDALFGAGLKTRLSTVSFVAVFVSDVGAVDALLLASALDRFGGGLLHYTGSAGYLCCFRRTHRSEIMLKKRRLWLQIMLPTCCLG
jgi:hypothetical protein